MNEVNEVMNGFSFGAVFSLAFAESGISLEKLLTTLGMSRANYYNRLYNFNENTGEMNTFISFVNAINLKVKFCFVSDDVLLDSSMCFQEIVETLNLDPRDYIHILKKMQKQEYTDMPLGFLIELLAIKENVSLPELAEKLKISKRALLYNLNTYNEKKGRIKNFLQTFNHLGYQVTILLVDEEIKNNP